MLIAMIPILINKDLFESRYNDIKFMVQNGNYLCANLNILPKDILFYLEHVKEVRIKLVPLVH